MPLLTLSRRDSFHMVDVNTSPTFFVGTETMFAIELLSSPSLPLSSEYLQDEQVVRPDSRDADSVGLDDQANVAAGDAERSSRHHVRRGVNEPRLADLVRGLLDNE